MIPVHCIHFRKMQVYGTGPHRFPYLPAALPTEKFTVENML